MRRPRRSRTINAINTKSLRALRNELTEAGVFERHEAKTWIRTAILLVLSIGLITAQILGPTWLMIVLMPVSALMVTAAVIVGHEGAHRSLSTSKFRNELNVHLLFSFIGGLGVMYWKYKHNILHHGHPNVVGTDEDLDLWPMASSKTDYDASGPLRRTLQKYGQWLLFWPLASFLTWSMHVSSVTYLVKHARNKGVDGPWLADVACQVGHYTMWLVVPSLIFGFLPALGFYLALWGVVSIYLSAIFLPAHIGLPLMKDHPGGWRLQLETTRNLRVPWPIRFAFGGLDYQIEHHLFPKIPHQNLPKAGEITRRWAQSQGLPYGEIGYFPGLWDATKFVAKAWKYEPQVG